MVPLRGKGPLRFLAFSVSAGVLAACAGDVIGEFPSPPSPAITASPTPELDEGILAEIPVDGSPCFLAEAGGRIWVTAFDGNELLEVDPATNEVIETYRMPGGPCGMVEHDGTLWIESQNSLVAFDPRRGEVVDRIRIPGGIFGTTSTPSGLWGIAPEATQVVQIDPNSRRVVARVDIEGPLGGLAVDGDQYLDGVGEERSRADRPGEPLDRGARSRSSPSSPRGSRSAGTSSGSRAPSRGTSFGSTFARGRSETLCPWTAPSSAVS